MTGILVIGRAEGPAPSTATLEAIALARTLGDTVTAGLIGADLAAAAAALAKRGLAGVAVVEDAALAAAPCEGVLAAAGALVAAVKPDLVLVAGETETADWAARLAIRLQAAFVPNCLSLSRDNGQLIARRAVCGGAMLADYAVERPRAVVTLVPGVAAPDAGEGACAITPIAMPANDDRVTLIETLAEDKGDGPPLKQAKTVISGGLGLGSRENWAVVEDTAAALGAAVGASRAAVEIGWAPSSRQVGFSGAKVKPDLYVAVGISGAVHHLAGMSGARTVVAINTDAEAPIFRHARYGIVGDAVEVLTAFAGRVRELRG